MACCIWLLSFSMRPSQTNTFFLNSVFLGNDRAQEISYSSPVLQTHGWMKRAEPVVAAEGSGPRKQSPCTPFITEQAEAQEGKLQKKGDTWHTGPSYSPEKATYVDVSQAFTTSQSCGLGHSSASRSLCFLVYKMEQHPPGRSLWRLRCNNALKGHRGPFRGDGLWRWLHSSLWFIIPVMLCP